MKSIFTGTKRLLKEYKKPLPILFFLVFIEGVLGCFGISLFLPTVEYFIYHGKANSKYGEMMFSFLQSIGINPTLSSFSVLIIIVFLVKTAISLFQQLLTSRIATQLYTNLRTDLVDSTLSLDYNYFTSMQTGNLCNAIQTESKKVVSALRLFMMVAVAVIYVISYMSAAIMISWKLTSAFLIVTSITAYFFNKVNVSSMAKGKESVRLSNLVNSRVIDVVTNLKYLKLISSNGKFFNSLKHNINQFSRNLFKIHRNNALLIAPTELFGILSFFLILMLGLYIKINIESIVVVALLFQRVYIKINDFYRNYQNYLIVLPGFTWIMDLKEDLKVHKGINGHVNIDKVPTISFSDVSFSYDKKRDILHSIDIAFDERKMIAIVGPSGSGKTTIVDLLCGFLSPDKGKICIGNQLLSDINRDSYRRLVSYIPQRPFLYNDTIRNNITLGEGRFLDEEIFRVSKLAHVDDFISRLPRKYDELIGDGGVKLSGGERQRIVLARELLKRPQLLILDEATNALDTETEEKIQHTIDNLIGKMTVVVIAHRFTTIKKADIIYVIENGSIIDSGNLEQLLERCKKFEDLYTTQMI